MPIMAEHYWAPVVEEIKGSGDTEQQIEALFAHVPDNEPTVGGFTFSKWEPGAFFENDAAHNYAWKGMVVTEYENGAYAESNERLDYQAAFYGDAEGAKTLEYEVEAPHVDTALFSIYGNQDAAILALTNGDIDYLFQPARRGEGLSGSHQVGKRPHNRVQRGQRHVLPGLQHPQGLQ